MVTYIFLVFFNEEKAGECPGFWHARISPFFQARSPCSSAFNKRYVIKFTCSLQVVFALSENFPFVKGAQSTKKGRSLNCWNPGHSHDFCSFIGQIEKYILVKVTVFFMVYGQTMSMGNSAGRWARSARRPHRVYFSEKKWFFFVFDGVFCENGRRGRWVKKIKTNRGCASESNESLI